MNHPTITARFALDGGGKPVVTERGDVRHYHIALEVDGAPEDAYAVTYKLDDSYPVSVREARDRTSRFREELTSYGDYVVQATIRGRGGIMSLAVPLSTALREGHSGAQQAEIQSALQDIAGH